MSAGDAAAPRKRNWWVAGAFAALAAVLIGMKCLCPDPFDAVRRQATDVADVRGAPLRAPAPAPVPAVSASVVASAPAIEPPAVTRSPDVVVAAETKPSAAQPAESVRAPVAPVGAADAEPKKPEPAAAKPVQAPPAVAGKAEPKFKVVTWDDISNYTYVPPTPDDDPSKPAAPTADKPQTDQIPSEIRAMAGKRVTIEGYVMAYEFEKGVVKKAILMSAPLACCFAEAPPMNKWIMVTNDGKSEFSDGKYEVVRVSGVFDVGEETREGYVVGIYRMKAEKIENVNE